MTPRHLQPYSDASPPRNITTHGCTFPVQNPFRHPNPHSPRYHEITFMTLRGTVQNSTDFQKRMRVMHKDYVVNGQAANPNPNP